MLLSVIAPMIFWGPDWMFLIIKDEGKRILEDGYGFFKTNVLLTADTSRHFADPTQISDNIQLRFGLTQSHSNNFDLPAADQAGVTGGNPTSYVIGNIEKL